MRRSRHESLTRVIFLIIMGWLTLPVWGQSTRSAAAETQSPSGDSQELARRKILDSDQWRQTNRSLNEWLSVQQIYNPDEVAAIRAKLAEKVANMSPRELEDLLIDMEERLNVLMSPEAEDARKWLAQFLAVARNPEAQLGRARPDVLNMTASQIRQELQWLQQTRAARQGAQAVFDRSRATQSQAARDVRATSQQVREPSQDRSAWPANNPRRYSQYAPRRELQPAPLYTPIYTVGPWGHPIAWHPMRGQW